MQCVTVFKTIFASSHKKGIKIRKLDIPPQPAMRSIIFVLIESFWQHFNALNELSSFVSGEIWQVMLISLASPAFYLCFVSHALMA